MEQRLLLVGGDAPRRVRIRQIFAALLWVGLPQVFVFFGVALWWSLFADASLDGTVKAVYFNGFVVSLCQTCGILLLLPIASNRIVRVAMRIGCCWSALYAVLHGVLCLIELPAWIWIAVQGTNVVGALVWAYCFALILRSGRMAESYVAWGGLLIVGYAMTCVSSGLPLCGLFVNVSAVYALFSFVCSVMLIVAYFKFVRSGAFSGDFDATAVPRSAYSPLNRYMAGAVVSAAAMLLVFWAYSVYAVPLLQEF